MKKLFSLIFLFGFLSPLFLVEPVFAEQITTQQNQRQFTVAWKDQQVMGIGFYRPYSQIIVTDETEEIVWQGQTDARGNFSFVLKKDVLDPTTEHTLQLAATDQFGRPILKQNGTADTLQALVLPGLQTAGKTDPFAEILLLDDNGKLLNKFLADENGNYTIFNAPQNSILRIQKENVKKDVLFREGSMEQISLDISNNGSTSISENTNTAVSKNQNDQNQQNTAPSPEQKTNMFFLSFLIVGIIGGIILSLFFFFKRWKENNV